MNTKAIKTSIVMLVAVSVLCILLCLVTILVTQNVNVAYASAQVEEDSEDWSIYTDSDRLLNSPYTIQEYEQELLHKTVRRTGSLELSVKCDNAIVDIVPRTCFTTRGNHFFIGKEYGFFVHTVADKYVNENDETIDCPYNNISDVMVFDITTETDLIKTKDQLITSVSPLFQYKYVYVDKRTNSFKLGSLNISCDIGNNDSCVFVMPYYINLTNPTTEITYSQTWNYYLKDISFMNTVANVQEADSIHYDYDPYEDKGSFITQFDYKYKGLSSKTLDTYDVVDASLSVASFALSALSLIPPISTVTGALSLVLSLVDFASSCSVLYSANNDIPTIVQTSNGVMTAQNLYSTKENQLRYYRDGNNNPRLVKNVTCLMFGNDKRENIWYGKDDYAASYCKISNSAGNDDPWYTQYIQNIMLNVVSKDGKTIVGDYEAVNCYYLYEPIYKETEIDTTYQLNALPQEECCFEFNPSYTSDYQMNVSSSEKVEVSIKQGNGEWVKLQSRFNYYEHKFEEDKKYYIKIKLPNTEIL